MASAFPVKDFRKLIGEKQKPAAKAAKAAAETR
jgi:hypothetical protein